MKEEGEAEEALDLPARVAEAVREAKLKLLKVSMLTLIYP